MTSEEITAIIKEHIPTLQLDDMDSYVKITYPTFPKSHYILIWNDLEVWYNDYSNSHGFSQKYWPYTNLQDIIYNLQATVSYFQLGGQGHIMEVFKTS